MTTKNEAIVFSSADKGRFTRAANAFTKSGTTFRTVIGELAKQYFPEGCTVAMFAKAAGLDLGMGKGVTAEDKATRNALRARIHDGLKVADLLKVNKRVAQAQGQRRKAEATEAADKAEEAKQAVQATQEAKAPTQAEVFAGIATMLEHASPATLRRIANAVAVKLAAAA